MQAAVLISEDQATKKLSKARCKLRRLMRKKTGYLTARSVFVADLNKIAQRRRKAGIYTDKHIGKRVFKSHFRLWKGISWQQKKMCEDEARTRQEVSRQQLSAKMGMCRADICALEKARTEASATKVASRMASCRLSSEQKAKLEQTWHEFDMAGADLRRRREEIGIGFSEPSLATRQTLESFAVDDPSDGVAAVLPWVLSVCKLRQWFSTALFRVVDTDGNEVRLRFLFALQRPVVAGFVRVQRHEVVEDFLDPEAMMADPPVWALHYMIEDMAFVYSDEEAFGNYDDRIFVVRESTLLGEGIIGTDQDWSPLQDVLRDLPAVLADMEQRDGAGARPRRPSDDALREHPWLLELLTSRQGAGSSGSSRRAHDHSEDHLHERDADEVLFEVDAETVLEDLTLRREEIDRADDGVQHFALGVRGGAWTAAHKGVAFDSYRAEAKTREAKAWTATWSFAASATFSLARFGHEDALTLCEFWVDKMKYLFALSREGGPEFVFDDVLLDSFPEPLAARELRARAAGHTARRLEGLTDLRPVRAK